MKKILVTAVICVVIIALAITTVVLRVKQNDSTLKTISVNEVTR